MFRRFAALFATALSLGACSDSTTRGTPATQVGVVKANLDGTETVTLDVSSTAPASGARVDFVAKGPIISDQSALSQTITGTWDPNFKLNAQPVIPEGWTLKYFAASTQLPSAPSTPESWASVTSVSATGSYQSDGSSNNGQYLVGSSSSTPPSAAGSLSGGAPGDGWNVFFSPDRTKVYNAHRRDQPATIMCRNAADGSACSDAWPYPVYHTSDRATGWVDPTTQRLWHETFNQNSMGGWQCIDTSGASPTDCATPFVAAFADAEGYNDHIDLQNVGRELYSFDAVHGALTCLNVDGNNGEGAPCAGQPYSGFAGATDTNALHLSGIKAIAGKIYILINTQISCFDPRTKAACTGMQWPKEGAPQPITPVPSADGIVRNLCTSGICYALDGTVSTLTDGYSTFLAAHPPESCCGQALIGEDTAGSKLFYPYGGDSIQCFDTATEAACPGFPIAVERPYSAVVDPRNANCLWTNSQDGIIRTWNIPNGEAGCSAPPPTAIFKPELAVPRLACGAANSIAVWDKFTLTAPLATEFTSATLTIKNSVGVPISGWVNRALNGNDPLDIRTLTLAQTGQTPDFEVKYANLMDTGSSSARFRVLGQTPEVCWSASARAACPSGGGLLPTSLPATATAAVTAAGSVTLADQPTVPFRSTTRQLSAPSETDTQVCGANLSGMITGPANVPISGATVELLRIDNSAVLDGTDPIVATSAGDGSFSFPPLLVGSYRLRVRTIRDRWQVSNLTVVTGGTGTARAANGQVISHVITLTSGLPGQANATFTGPVDDDRDGLPNYVEKGADLDNPIDSDGDTVHDYRDLDADNDGILDLTERGANSGAPRDTDDDDIPDYLDLDSDGDAIADAYEALPDPERQLDSKGAIAGAVDLGNGIPVSVQTSAGSGVLNYAPNDQNDDSTPDYLSADSDGDGVSDRLERGSSGLPVNSDRNSGTGDDTPDYLDLDSDGDSISDQSESNFDGSTVDTDEDGAPDRIDLDSDNDGIPDRFETNSDQDGDNTANYRDRDSDGDGVTDQNEGNLPGDSDTAPNYLDLDSDNDTIPDSVEQGDREQLLDTDEDELPNYLDTDSDEDGIPDATEAGSNAQYPRDSDGDNTPDYLDEDSDNDTIPDAIERGSSATLIDTDRDGTPDYRDTDSDNDTVTDRVESGAEGGTPRNTDSDTLPDYLDPDSDDDLIRDLVERGSGSTLADSDGDGKPDMLDEDSDADGISDRKEGGADPDRDNIGTWLDPDSDGDSISDKLETDADDDGDTVPNYLDGDSDEDGMSDTLEAGSDPTKPSDTDGDAVPDYLDSDADNDCVPDRLETSYGVLVASTPNANANDNCTEPGDDRCDTTAGYCTRGCAADSDCGGPGSGAICNPNTRGCSEGCRSDGNQCEAGAVCTATLDNPGKCLDDDDGDGIPDEVEVERGLDPRSEDSDGDGIPDAVEAHGGVLVDTDRDGVPDVLDMDADGDGIADRLEVGDDAQHPRDTDTDGVADYLDQDADGDGWPDSVERADDTDGDAVPDYIDLDSDGDGVSDAEELTWGLSRNNADTDRDGILDADEAGAGPDAADSDGDGRLDAVDLDSDNDSIPDNVERGDGEAPADLDEDGLSDYRDLDTDNDGIPDESEARNNRDQIADSDGDGLYDYRDTDSDDDGLSDGSESGTDTDGDGVPDYRDLDSDNDCLSDQTEAAEETQLDASRPSTLASDNCPAEAPICAPRTGLCITADRLPPRDCTEDNASSVCVSGECDPSTNRCVAVGCTSDATCSLGMYCDGDAMMCVPQLGAGDKLLTDEIHSGACNDALAAQICESGVCNPHTNRCANRDGESCKEASDCASNACVEAACVSRSEVPTASRLGGGCSALRGANANSTWVLLSVLGGLGFSLRRARPRRRT